MDVRGFCRTLSLKLNEFKESSSGDSLAPIEDKIRKFEEKVAQQLSQEAVIAALFDLSVCIDKQSSTLRMPVLSETFSRLISIKIEEISSVILSSASSFSQNPLLFDREIQETEKLLACARMSLAGFTEDRDGLLAATASIFDLEQKLEKLQREKAVAVSTLFSQKTSSAVVLGCAGLRNTSNKCYAYGCLKGLWASKKFREIIESKATDLEAYQAAPKKEGDPVRRLTALFLYRLFLNFDATSSFEIIEPEDKAIQDVIEEMTKYHPLLANGKQQDATEFLNWLLADIFENGECLFSYIEHKRRPQELTVDFCIPNIDIPQTSRGNLFIIQLPGQENASITVQSAFESTIVEESIEQASVLLSEKNKDKDQGAIFEILSKVPSRVHVQKKMIFQGTPPPCLFVHFWRQIKEVTVPIETLKEEMDPTTLSELHLTEKEIVELFGRKEKVKVPSHVTIPPVLFIHHIDRPQIQYRLKGVIIHAGTPDAGHYYSYLSSEEQKSPSSSSSSAPVQALPPTVADQSGLPPPAKRQRKVEDFSEATQKSEPLSSAPLPSSQQRGKASQKELFVHASRFVRHDDHRVSGVSYDQKLESEFQQQGYVLIYDIVD
jgi:hypothetical protein